MTQLSNAEQNCFNHIGQWLSEGNTLDSLTAGKLHLLSGEFYTTCITALKHYQEQQQTSASAAEASAETLEILFSDFRQKILHEFQKAQCDNPDKDHDDKVRYWQQLADERLEVIASLETRISEQRQQVNVSDAQQQGRNLQQQEDHQAYRELEQQLAAKQQQIHHLEEQLVDKDARSQQLEQTLSQEQKQAERKHSDLKNQITELEQSLSESTSSRQDFDQQIREMRMQTDQLKHQVSVLEQELSREKHNHILAQELSNEQAKEIAELSRKLDLAEQEFLRINNLYQELKKARD